MNGLIMLVLLCFLSFSLLKNLKDFPFLMAQSGIYGKSSISTSTTFCKENETIPTLSF